MLFARWQHHIRFGSGFPYASLKAMLTKISKWSRIQDSFQITLKIKSLVVFAIPDIPWKFQKNPSITFWVILLTHRQTDRQTNYGKNITSLAEVITEHEGDVGMVENERQCTEWSTHAFVKACTELQFIHTIALHSHKYRMHTVKQRRLKFIFLTYKNVKTSHIFTDTAKKSLTEIYKYDVFKE